MFCFDFLYKYLSETFLILKGIQQATIINTHKSSSVVPFIFVQFKWKSNFVEKTSEKKSIQTSAFTKIRQVRAELLHADRQTDERTDRHDETSSRFSQSVKASKTRVFKIYGSDDAEISRYAFMFRICEN
jgi:hypothetical protein